MRITKVPVAMATSWAAKGREEGNVGQPIEDAWFYIRGRILSLGSCFELGFGMLLLGLLLCLVSRFRLIDT